MSDDSASWGQDGVRLCRTDRLDVELVQSLAEQRIAALTHLPTGTHDTSGGVLALPPGSAVVCHAPGPEEYLYMVTRGRLGLRWGEHLEYSGTAEAGEGIRVPPWVRHAESNSSDQDILERLCMVTGR